MKIARLLLTALGALALLAFFASLASNPESAPPESRRARRARAAARGRGRSGRRLLLFAVIGTLALAATVLPSSLGGTYAPFTDTATGSGSVAAGYWQGKLEVKKVYSDDNTTGVSVAVSCDSPAAAVTTPLTASPALAALFTIDDVPFGGTFCTATETVPDGYSADQAPCFNQPIVAGQTASCTITNTLNSATFHVSKDFSDDSTDAVTIGLTCGSGSVAVDDATATESPADTADFTVTGIIGASTTCTATETEPDGYSQTNSTCTNVQLLATGTASCAFTNTLNSATFKVAKDFSDNAATAVAITLTCDSGSVVVVSSTATDTVGGEAVFTVNGIEGSTQCDAHETTSLPGYTVSEAACQDVVTSETGTTSCTIVNTAQPTLTITKVCDPVGDTGRFNLLIDGVAPAGGSDASCGVTTTAKVLSVGQHTVSETAGTATDLANYSTVIGGDCASNGTITLAAGQNANCTVTNSRLPTLTITKTCVPANDTGKFNLLIDGAAPIGGANASCSVTTTAKVLSIGAHTVSETAGMGTDLATYGKVIGGDCAANGSITLAAGQNANCTITNSKTTAQFLVLKDFSDTNANNVTVSLSCTSGSVANDDTTASEADPANFTVTGFAGDPTCTATESPVPDGYVSAPCSALLSAGQCTIVNTKNLPANVFAMDSNRDLATTVPNGGNNGVNNNGNATDWWRAFPTSATNASNYTLSLVSNGIQASSTLRVTFFYESGSGGCGTTPAAGSLNILAQNPSVTVSTTADKEGYQINVPLVGTPGSRVMPAGNKLCLRIDILSGASVAFRSGTTSTSGVVGIIANFTGPVTH